ncbi:hypothetical protein [Leptospira stimsonii]|uniref:Uncharacterized protein n=1 Tax=Leptospira stimsonii TaxID=2202203 RepID=A0A8B3CL75_9LEPT|nr:hypothetical protein [Leptospira stimsonii]RHX84222.1 hypothetical protein DLM78_19320 [Leptospira stimsonii]
MNELYKIDFNSKNEKIKTKLVRYNFTYQSLLRSLRNNNYLIDKINFSDSPDLILEAVSIASIIAYSSSFNSNFGIKVPDTIFSQNALFENGEKKITEIEFHKSILAYRNQHIAHIGDKHKFGDVGYIGNEITLVPAQRKFVEEVIFYKGLNKLIKKIIPWLEEKITDNRKKISDAIASGEVTILDEKLFIDVNDEVIFPTQKWTFLD